MERYQSLGDAKGANAGAARLDKLDVVRGLAALSVAFVHLSSNLQSVPWMERVVSVVFAALQQTFWVNEGVHPGVIVFIVLSGFCIHYPLSVNRELATAPGYWKTYASRRFFRIFPVFLFGCFLGAVSADQYSLEYAVFMSPVLPTSPAPVGNDILDTVIAEMWLYATYPLSLWIFRKFGAGYLLVVAGCVAAVPIAFVIFDLSDSSWASRSVFAFFPYWILGMLAAEHRRARSIWFIWGSFVLYVLIGQTMHFAGIAYFKSLILALWVALLMSALSYGPSWRIATWPGTVSYSLYVVHLPVAYWWISRGGEAAYLVFVVIGATLICYCCVELPCHRLSQAIRLRY